MGVEVNDCIYLWKKQRQIGRLKPSVGELHKKMKLYLF